MQEYMPNTRFKESIEIDTIMMSRHHMDKLLNRLGQYVGRCMRTCGRYYPCCVQRLIECHHGGGAAAKYTSDSYDILRCNCNHFTEDLCMAVCGKQVCAPTTLSCARPLSLHPGSGASDPQSLCRPLA
jgi:hypothetical protein